MTTLDTYFPRPHGLPSAGFKLDALRPDQLVGDGAYQPEPEAVLLAAQMIARMMGLVYVECGDKVRETMRKAGKSLVKNCRGYLLTQAQMDALEARAQADDMLVKACRACQSAYPVSIKLAVLYEREKASLGKTEAELIEESWKEYE